MTAYSLRKNFKYRKLNYYRNKKSPIISLAKVRL
nr:MAG TPA: hypothetical protein [Caudoviricetes sp.]